MVGTSYYNFSIARAIVYNLLLGLEGGRSTGTLFSFMMTVESFIYDKYYLMRFRGKILARDTAIC